jgi:uncharacterized protein (TIGR02246 family)
MKNLLLSALSICGLFFLAQTTQAQSNKTEFESFKNYLDHLFKVYDGANVDEILKYYVADAQEIGPDGSLVSGVAGLKANWDTFVKMLDKKPVFTHKLVSARTIRPDVAIITFEQDADLLMGGQQVGGKSICMAVLTKKDNLWMIEFDSMTPIVPMPIPSSTGNK